MYFIAPSFTHPWFLGEFHRAFNCGFGGLWDTCKAMMLKVRGNLLGLLGGVGEFGVGAGKSRSSLGGCAPV